MLINKKRLSALDGLRVLATAGIFLFHSGFLPHGTFPVTLFFMLSGFMMYYTKYDKITMMTGVRKMGKMYPLHLITFIISIFVWHPWMNSKYTMAYLIKAGVMHLTLTQAWFPEYTYTYNGLAWYLSVTLFLYAISFPLVFLTKKVKKPILWMILLLFIIISLDMYSKIYGGGYLYSNPFYRMLDYVLGMMIAKQFQQHEFTDSKKADKIEMGLVIIFIIQYIMSFLVDDTPGYYSVLFSIALYIFAIGRGRVSRILSYPVFHTLACYSFEFYMIHELVLRVFRRVFPEPEVFSKVGYIMREIKISIPSLIISMLYAWVYKNCLESRMRLN